eukprot:gene11753-biopygen22915
MSCRRRQRTTCQVATNHASASRPFCGCAIRMGTISMRCVVSNTSDVLKCIDLTDLMGVLYSGGIFSHPSTTFRACSIPSLCVESTECGIGIPAESHFGSKQKPRACSPSAREQSSAPHPGSENLWWLRYTEMFVFSELWQIRNCRLRQRLPSTEPPAEIQLSATARRAKAAFTVILSRRGVPLDTPCTSLEETLGWPPGGPAGWWLI